MKTEDGGASGLNPKPNSPAIKKNHMKIQSVELVLLFFVLAGQFVFPFFANES